MADTESSDPVKRESTRLTCVATNGGILLRGATPVFVDIHPDTGLIDAEAVKAAITSKTAAIMA